MIQSTRGNRNRVAFNGSMIVWTSISVLLVLPALAHLLTDQMQWGAEDFVAAAALLIGGGAAYELATGVLKQRQIVAAGLVALVVMVLWADAAVGVF